MAWFEGHWKLVRNGPPLGDNQWRLYDIEADPGETTDLAAEEPERFEAMQAAYAGWAEENGVLEMPEGYDPIDTVAEQSRQKLRERYWWAYLLALVLVVGIVAAPIWLIVRRRRRKRAVAA
jgi:arylsulfatase/uncharacterized sulfatase